jgi:hypothetical protein
MNEQMDSGGSSGCLLALVVAAVGLGMLCSLVWSVTLFWAAVKWIAS